jgi:uncharacterized protein YdhG (YjbR/CyaY superfamily)
MPTMISIKFQSINEYISTFPPNVQLLLETLRKAIKEASPDAIETISYNMPAFKYSGRILVYFAAHTKHIGFYPGNSVTNEVFKDDLISYETSKGTVKFPFDNPIPVRLVKKIVKYKTSYNLDKANSKKRPVTIRKSTKK